MGVCSRCGCAWKSPGERCKDYGACPGLIVEDKAAWEPLVERLVDFILDPHGAGKPITRATPEQQLKQIASRLRLLSEHRHAAR